MKYIYTLATVSLLAIGSLGGFKAGCYWQTRQDNQAAVEADAGHYNPHSAEFEYGSAASASLVTMNVDNLVGDALKPSHKPKVQ